MRELTLYLVSSSLILLWITGSQIRFRRHEKKLKSIPLRIHVNGIRGKSTVSRIVAGLLREAGICTVGKTTGSAACIIPPDGNDKSIVRNGAPTILEQIDFVREHVSAETRAIVVECMALKPEYQHVCESRIVQSNIGIITNVREDHQDVMGETLKEIAVSLANTCPRDGVLITAEQDARLAAVLRKEADRRNTRLIVVDPNCVEDSEVAAFEYIAFKENVAIGMAVAQLLQIPRNIAMQGMVRAAPDPGVLQIRKRAIRSEDGIEKQITWANLLAVNDRQSVVKVANSLMADRTDNTTIVGLLNNRNDREVRAMQFVDIVANELQFDRIAALGAYESAVCQRLRETGYPPEKIVPMGEERNLSLHEMLARLVFEMPTENVLLVGMVNIHTQQAETLLGFLEPNGNLHRGVEAGNSCSI